MAGGGCYLDGACCDGSVTKNVGDVFSHRAGGSHSYVPINAFCYIQCNIYPEIKVSGVWVAMGKGSGTPITTNKTIGKAYTYRPCQKNITFTLTVQSSAGGTTQNCRYRAVYGRNIAYCYFNVTVNAPVTALQRVMICTT